MPKSSKFLEAKLEIESEMMGGGNMGKNSYESRASSSSSKFMVLWECLNVGVLKFVLLENPILQKPKKVILYLPSGKFLMKRGWRWLKNVIFL